MEGKVAVLGSADFVMPFAALGLETYAVGDSRDEITDAATKIVAGDHALVVVAENIAPVADAVLTTTQNRATPCILVVPFTTESQGFATDELGKVLKMATGINILEHD